MYNIKQLDKKAYDGEYEHVISCPMCDENYVHFENPSGEAGDDVSYTQWSGRGGCIRIPMRCEFGHYWDMAIGFHKGYTYIFNTNKQTSARKQYFDAILRGDHEK